MADFFGLFAWIDRTTMYRLVLYYVVLLFGAGVIGSALGFVPYAPLALAYAGVVVGLASWAGNRILAYLFNATTNRESWLITALILVLIFDPVSPGDLSGTLVLAGISLAAVLSKYLVAYRKKHVFNPAAFAAVLAAVLIGDGATWWAGTTPFMIPFVLLGALVAYKIRRAGMVLAFAGAALATSAALSEAPLASAWATLAYSPLFYFAFVMFTEPQTTPPTRSLGVLYAVLVGVLFAPGLHAGDLYFTPELALVVGNLFSFAVSPKGRRVLTLVERRERARGIYEYVFAPDRPLAFRPGQYLEWTLGAVERDQRGNRRFFTIASAPEDEHIRLGVRFYERPSAFKRRLAALVPGDTIAAASLAGDFLLPDDRTKKLAFIAGGIGVTPFVSMARHMVAANERRDAVLVYSTRTSDEASFEAELAAAGEYGLRTVPVRSDERPIDAARIAAEIPDYLDRRFYLSGPPGHVDAMKKILRSLGVSPAAIQTDYFPGLA